MISSLFTVPFYKIRYSWAFLRSLILIIALGFLAGKVVVNFDLGALGGQKGFLNFPYIWLNTAWLIRYLNYLMAFLIISVVRRDVEENPIRQSIINGWNPWQVVTSYGLTCAFMAKISLLILIGLAGYFGRTKTSSIIDWPSIMVLFLFWGQSFLLFSAGVLIALFSRSSISAAIGLIMWNLLAEGVAGQVLSLWGYGHLSTYLPFQSMSNLLPSPIVPPFSSTEMKVDNLFIGIGCGYAALFWILSWLRVRFCDH